MNTASPRSDIQRESTSSGSGSNCSVITNYPKSKPTRVLTHPHLAVIAWNSSVWSEVSGTNGVEFYSDIANSSYIQSLNGDYGVSGGVYLGTYTITPQTFNTSKNCFGASCSISDTQINTELSYQISHNVSLIPTPEGDGVDGKGFANNLVYIVHLPPNYGLTQNSGSQCGFHSQMTDNAGHIVSVIYMADMSPGSTCAGQQGWSGTGSSIIDAFQMASHEIIESVVNPFPTTHYNGEIGDICQCNQFYTGYPGIVGGSAAWTTFAGFWKTWSVQQPYMLSTHSCQAMQIAPPPTPSLINSSGFAVARTSENLDVFWSATFGTLTTASRLNSNPWVKKDLYAINSPDGIVAGGQIAATSRAASNVDLFYITDTGVVQTTGLQWNDQGAETTGISDLTGSQGYTGQPFQGANYVEYLAMLTWVT